MTNGAVQLSLLLPLAIVSCGGDDSALVHLDPHARYAVQVVREQTRPAYRCEGVLETGASMADFTCTAENLPPWVVRGPFEHFELRDVVRLWIRQAGPAQQTGQPDIAVDLEPLGERFSGWGTVLFRDGTGSGHPGATADAWRIEGAGALR